MRDTIITDPFLTVTPWSGVDDIYVVTEPPSDEPTFVIQDARQILFCTGLTCANRVTGNCEHLDAVTNFLTDPETAAFEQAEQARDES